MVVGLLFVPSTRALAEPAPSVAVTLIKEQERLYRELINRNEAEFAVIFDYLRELKTGSNWSTTLHKSPKEFPRLVRPLHEVMQFYFAGRKHYDEEETIDTLLDLPRIPFDIAKSLDASELTHLARADLQLRIAWFQRLSGLDLKTVLENDPTMVTTGLCLQFIRDLERPHLLQQMTGDDLDALMNCLERLPEFSEQYLSNLVRIHETRFPGNGYFADREAVPNRFAVYQSLVQPFQTRVPLLYSELWEHNPATFASRIATLGEWLESELSRASHALADIKNWKEDGMEATNQCVAALQELGVALGRYRIPFSTNGVVLPTSSLSETQLKHVAQISTYLCDAEARFFSDIHTTPDKSSEKEKGGSEAVRRRLMSLRQPLAIWIAYYEKCSTPELKYRLVSLTQRLVDMKRIVSGESPKQ